jgi:RNA polymerase-binding transcription factor DksA
VALYFFGVFKTVSVSSKFVYNQLIMNIEYKNRLEEMLVQITDELKTVGIHNPQNPSDWIAVPENLDAEEPDANVSADSIEEWNERSALVATFERKYNGILSALARIENNSFGVCEICAQTIEDKRLEVNPIARTCIAHLNDESTLEA